MTLILGRTLSQNSRAGISVLAGVTTGGLLHTVLAVAGLSALIAASPSAFWFLKMAGAAYLLLLAFQAIFQGSTLKLGNGPRRQRSLWNNYFAGLSVDLLNPKVVLFYLTFLPQFVTASDPHAWQKMLFLGIIQNAVSVPINLAIVLTAERFAFAMRNRPAVSRVIDCIFGGFFAVFAIRIFLTASR